MPFGPYTDFADCVSKNDDKADPSAYCGYIQNQVEKAGRTYEDVMTDPDLEPHKKPADDSPKAESAPTVADLALINRYTLRELTADEVFTFTALVIDDTPTANSRVWTVEWQRDVVGRNLFDGVSILENHDNDQQLVMGRIFKAWQKDNAVYARAYVPITDAFGQDARERIEVGRARAMSINAKAPNMKQEGTLSRVLPDPNERIYEVSFVGVGGNKNARVIESLDNAQGKAELVEFAREELQKTRDEYVKYSAFALGLEAIDRELYRKVAESIDPVSSRKVVNDLKAAYLARSKNEQLEVNQVNTEIATAQKALSDSERIRARIEAMRKDRGI